MIEQANAVAGAPARIDIGRRRAHGGAGDVQMSPGHARFHEAKQKLRGRNGTRVATADILHVRELGIDHLVVFLGQRKPPRQLADVLSRRADLGGKRVVVREQACIFPSECDKNCTGDRRQRDDEFRLQMRLRIPQEVRENEFVLRHRY